MQPADQHGATGASLDVPDLPPDEFRRMATRAVEIVARYLEDPERWPVLPTALRPGDLIERLPADAPVDGEPMERLLDDLESLIMPATTHWNHPGFMAYFGISGSGPGIIAELLIAALNVNAMLWRSGPAQTELEQVALAWLRRMMGLDDDAWHGQITDTASSSTLWALAAAREHAGHDTRRLGLAGRPDVPRMRIYCSEEAHSSVDKAAITIGLGVEGVRRVATDDRLRMDAAALRAAIAEDRAAGVLPIAVVATVGTTSTTAVDPVAAIADVCEAEGVWLHVDAAYGGAAATLPELRPIMDGCERADSLVVNPHKWLFVPIDCSALYTRRPDVLRRAFSVVPVYLESEETMNLMDYGVALGRRFRALKLWFVLRWFGAAGVQARIREHIRLARLLDALVDADPEWQRPAQSEMSVVVMRWVGRACTQAEAEAKAEARPTEELDAINQAIIDRVNASGEVFISHTRVRGRLVVRVAIGNLRTTERHVRRAWQLIREAAAEVIAGR